MRTGWLTDPRYLDHDTGKGHPERPDRLRSIVQAVEGAGLIERLERLAARPATADEVAAVHEQQYVERLIAACNGGARYIDVPDSAICPASYEVALLAAGGVLAACDAVMAGQVRNAFCAIRPPGHHCHEDYSMGFCLLNNAAIAARYLRRRHGLGRVLILDWDVHHANGTQHVFEKDGSVFLCSFHEHPTYRYPGSGYVWEQGEGPGRGCILNIPMLPHATDEDYMNAYRSRFLPAAREFNPQFILVCAGFDAHADDPLATQDVTQDGFDWLALQARRLAHDCCGGRLVSLLEGGYNLEALSRCVVSHLEILLEEDPCSSATA